MTRITSLILAAAATLLSAGSTAMAQERLNLFAWSEYVPQAVIDGFTEETGIRVNYESYASNEEMMTKLLAGATKYDLIMPSDYAIESLAKMGKLQELDKAKLPNFKNLDPKYLNLGFDPEQKYSMPYLIGTVGIVYNSEVVQEPVKGLKDVFQPKNKGRIVVVDDAREMVTWVLNVQGKDINDITPEVLAGTKSMMGDWMKLIKVYDSDSPKTALLNGEVDYGIVWSGEAAILFQEDPKFQYVLPSEGAHMYVDSMCMPVDAPNKDAAYKFLDYLLRPEVSKLMSDEFPYTNPNLEARKLLTEEQLKNAASYPPGDPKLDLFRDIGKTASDIDQVYTDLKSGS